jgi:hypothetical protein
MIASKIKGKVVVGKDKEVVSNLLIAFPAKERLASHLNATQDYSVSEGSKHESGTTLTEEIVLTHRYNTLSHRVEFWPGSHYPFQEGYARSSILGGRKEIYAKTETSHSFTQTSKGKDGKMASHGMDPATYKHSDDFKKGEPANTTEALPLFLAVFAQCFVPIDQEPFNALWALEDVVHESLTSERSTMEALLLSLQKLRQLAPTHFHYDIYSLQHEIIRARLPKCTKDFSIVAKGKKRKQREAKPQKGAKWPSSGKAPAKRQKVVKKITEALKAVSFGDSPAPATPAPATSEAIVYEASEPPSTLLFPARPSAANTTLESQLAQAQLMLQRLQQQQAVASQQQNEAALPSSTSIPSTPNSEQGGANPVVETEKK